MIFVSSLSDFVSSGIQLAFSVLAGRLICLRGRNCLWLYGICCSRFLEISIEFSYAFVR
jgi:hypothetical protein